MRMPTVVRRWAYTGALVGAGVSVAANILHSYVPPDGMNMTWQPATGAVVGAVFWPVALLIAIEIFARWHPDAMRFKALRWLGLVPVAVVAAVVSYRHMSGLLAWWHEDPVTVVIGPLAVDGIMVMAAGALIATNPIDQVGPAAAPVALPTPPATPPANPAPAAEKPQVTAPAARPRPPVQQARPSAPPPEPQAEQPLWFPSTARLVADARKVGPDRTQKDVAALTGLSVRTVARYWRVTNPPGLHPVPAAGHDTGDDTSAVARAAASNGGMTHDP